MTTAPVVIPLTTGAPYVENVASPEKMPEGELWRTLTKAVEFADEPAKKYTVEIDAVLPALTPSIIT